MRIVQETEYPSRGQVLIQVEPESPVAFRLKLRIPAWCEGATVRVNGEPATGSPEAGSFFAIDRKWQAGDKVELDLPLRPRWHKGTGVHADEVALLYGPLLFCVNPKRQVEEVRQQLVNALVVEKGINPRCPISLDADSLSAPEQDISVRPAGLAFRAKVKSGNEAFPVLFTEFTDPEGTWAYVRSPSNERDGSRSK